MIEWMMNNR